VLTPGTLRRFLNIKRISFIFLLFKTRDQWRRRRRSIFFCKKYFYIYVSSSYTQYIQFHNSFDKTL